MKKILFALCLLIGQMAEAQVKSPQFQIKKEFSTSNLSKQYYEFESGKGPSQNQLAAWFTQQFSVNNKDEFRLLQKEKVGDHSEIRRYGRWFENSRVLNNMIVVQMDHGKAITLVADLPVKRFNQNVEKARDHKVDHLRLAYTLRQEYGIFGQLTFTDGQSAWVGIGDEAELCIGVTGVTEQGHNGVDVYLSPKSNEVVLVDQHMHFSRIQVPTRACTKHSDTVTINVSFDTTDQTYYLIDSSRLIDVQIEHDPFSPWINEIPTSQDTLWSDSLERELGFYDAYYGAQVVYDFFKDRFNRQSFDGNQSRVKLVFKLNETIYANQTMWYDDGEILFVLDSNEHSLTQLDNIAHEFTHGLISSTADFITMDEPGSLAESMADIFALATVYFHNPSAFEWVFSEMDTVDTWIYAVRNFANPRATLQPDVYPGFIEETSLNSYVGKYRFSGIMSHAFYLLVEGKAGRNGYGIPYDVQAIGWDKALRIFYHALTRYMTPNTNFEEGALWVFKATEELFGPCSEESTSVRNAMKAVGLDKHIPDQKVSFEKDGLSPCTEIKQIQFYNTSKFGASYLWDFGDGTTSTEAYPLHEFEDFGVYDVQLIVTPGPEECFASDTLMRKGFVVLQPIKAPEVCMPVFSDFNQGMIEISEVWIDDYHFAGHPEIKTYEDFTCRKEIPVFIGQELTVRMKLQDHIGSEMKYVRFGLDNNLDGRFEWSEYNFLPSVKVEDSVVEVKLVIPEVRLPNELYRLRIGFWHTMSLGGTYTEGSLNCETEITGELHDFVLKIAEEPELPENPIANLWPNPALDQIQVSMHFTEAVEAIGLMDVNSRELSRMQPNGNEIQMDVLDLSPGFYFFYSEMTSGERFIHKFVVK